MRDWGLRWRLCCLRGGSENKLMVCVREKNERKFLRVGFACERKGAMGEYTIPTT